MLNRVLGIIVILFFLIQVTNAQKPKRYSVADIQLKLQQLNVLGTVLYVAAHPDDENTSLISYFANEEKLYTGYISLTRGDGGQNLIGPEIRDQLGVIRTQELLSARRIDGGKQFFSRANDFGYSKTPSETFNIWDKEQVLGDLVWVIRKFRPDVIITRFNTNPGETHGHHTASALLAEEAFDLAGDPDSYKSQLEYVEPWQPKSLYWNTYWWRRSEAQRDTAELLEINVGKFNPLLGKSYTEIAAESRSQHKSQGFGATGSRGKNLEYLQFIKGEEAGNHIFESIDRSWSRIEGGKGLSDDIKKINKSFDPLHPAGIVPKLISLRKKVKSIEHAFWRKRKLNEIDELIYACTGLFIEGIADDYSATNGDSVIISLEAINRSDANIRLESYAIKKVDVHTICNKLLKRNSKIEKEEKVKIPLDLEVSQPYWLKKEGTKGMFKVEDQLKRGLPENGDAIKIDFELSINGEKIQFTKPLVYKRNDPVKGEVYRPFIIIPPVSVSIDGNVWMFPNENAREVPVKVKAGKANIRGEVKLDLPENWTIEPAKYEYKLENKGEERTFQFSVKPPSTDSDVKVSAQTTINGDTYTREMVSINYDHIPAQVMFEPAASRFVRVKLRKKGQDIGYLMGSGDAIPEALEQIGYKVEIINDKAFTPQVLDQYDAIIIGVRAFNTVNRLNHEVEKLFDYAKRGGTLIVQYNTSYRMITENLAPYKLELSRDRVTVEEAEIKIINPGHPVVNQPNKITQQDFNGWVQERGLYFPGEWSDQFETVLSSHDPGEKPLKSGVLVAEHGEGYYIYTSYSWFRELPAGIPGAFRIFTNLISIGK